MAKNKTKTTGQSVDRFLKSVPDEQKRKDSFTILEVMRDQTGLEPYMWGPSIVGFGSYHYKYESGHEGDAPLVGFSPRKPAIVLYFSNFDGKAELLKKLGKHKASVSCIYIKKMEDVNIGILRKMVKRSAEFPEEKYS
jgi:hypothetical protein